MKIYDDPIEDAMRIFECKPDHHTDDLKDMIYGRMASIMAKSQIAKMAENNTHLSVWEEEINFLKMLLQTLDRNNIGV